MDVPPPAEIAKNIVSAVEGGRWDHENARRILEGLNDVQNIQEAEISLFKTGKSEEKHLHDLVAHAFGENPDAALRAWLVLAALHRAHTKGVPLGKEIQRALAHYDLVLLKAERILSRAGLLDVSGAIRALGAEIEERMGPYARHPVVRKLLKSKFGI